MIYSPEIRMITQREYGVISPLRDKTRVSRLVTTHLDTCFCLAIHNQSDQIGLFTHLDEAVDLLIVAKDGIPLFSADTRGQKVSIRTVNLAPRVYQNMVIGREIIADRQNLVEQLAETLTVQYGMSVLGGLDDIGQLPYAIFDIDKGLSATKNFSDLYIGSAELLRAIAQMELIMLQSMRPNSKRIITCGYKPNYVTTLLVEPVK